MFSQYNKVQKAVLETTLNIIIVKELQATSMSLIAKESGVSTGNIYHYFKSKEEIVNELYRAIVAYNGTYVINGINKGESIREKFNLGWQHFFQLCKDYPQGFQFIEQYSFSPYIYDEVKLEAYRSGWCLQMDQLYEEAIQEGLIKKEDPNILVQMHTGSVVYMMKGHLNGSLKLSDETIRRAIESFWIGIAHISVG